MNMNKLTKACLASVIAFSGFISLTGCSSKTKQDKEVEALIENVPEINDENICTFVKGEIASLNEEGTMETAVDVKDSTVSIQVKIAKFGVVTSNAKEGDQDCIDGYQGVKDTFSDLAKALNDELKELGADYDVNIEITDFDSDEVLCSVDADSVTFDALN